MKERLDVLLYEGGLAESRHRAQAMILAGEAYVDGQIVTKAGTKVPSDARIEIRSQQTQYVSRGGLKLEGGLEDFGIDASGKVCADIGSSTGGFTDCLLQHGAARVHAVDVTTSQLHWKLQNDARVRPVRCNVRNLRPEDIGESVDIVTIDVSFISVAKILPTVAQIAAHDAIFLILVKPQFELERRDVGKGGIVRDSALHERAIQSVWHAAEQAGLRPEKWLPSRLAGAEGNQEFFILARSEA